MIVKYNIEFIPSPEDNFKGVAAFGEFGDDLTELEIEDLEALVAIFRPLHPNDKDDAPWRKSTFNDLQPNEKMSAIFSWFNVAVFAKEAEGRKERDTALLELNKDQNNNDKK